MIVQEIINTTLRSIEAVATASVASIKAHVFKMTGKVAVSNFPKTQQVKGTVIVGNQKKLEDELKKLNKAITAVNEAIAKNRVDEVKVTNIPTINIPKYPTEIAVNNFQTVLKALGAVVQAIERIKLEVPKPLSEIKVSNFPKPMPFPSFPASIEVSNFPKTKDIDLAELISAIKAVETKVTAIKLDPQVSVTGTGKYAYSTSTGMKNQALIDADRHVQVDVLTLPNLDHYQLADFDTTEVPNYIGYVTAQGGWYIKTINKTAGQVRFVKGSSNYVNAWANRDSLNYQYFYEVFNA